MIVLTRLNDSQFAVNPDLIERILANPDTTLVMVDGAKYIVTESMGEVIDLITRYRAEIIRMARGVPPVQAVGTPPLGLVPALAEGKPATTIPLRPRNV
ncbi:flagellar FlbD family protein [Arthrobacter roseus]|uniref:flagellar FlbD family protein n=1 Tax=Arthrobacter roseus TaxID=136274 RepID=UPI00196444F9|nr:flagellar FlbD family protein [Arthrobacter roseus]MBM7847668.1 flagellar protein FlbD [Arthrobacter roseus]